MRIVAFCLIATLLYAASPARADDLAPADRHSIEQVITSQLDAFRHDAATAAFGYASPKIQSMFGTAPNFLAMVAKAYPPVYRPRSFAFEQLDTTDGLIIQQVRIIGPDGNPALALYSMEREADGTWRIDGCTLTRPHDLST